LNLSTELSPRRLGSAGNEDLPIKPLTASSNIAKTARSPYSSTGIKI
jgi:hypothetical protein